MSTLELTEAAKHQDWMEKMEELIHQFDLLNQNMSGFALILAALSERMNIKEKPKGVKRQ